MVNSLLLRYYSGFLILQGSLKFMLVSQTLNAHPKMMSILPSIQQSFKRGVVREFSPDAGCPMPH